MTATPPTASTGRPSRPLVVDLVRAYEGILLGLVVVVLALVASSGTLGPAEFAALIAVPAVTLALNMRRGAPREVFRLRAAGAVLGWIVAWVLFPPLFLVAHGLGAPLGGEYTVFSLLAILDGVVLGLVLTAVDRLGMRRRPWKSPGRG